MHVESDVYRNRTISIHVEAAAWIDARSRSLATTPPSFLSPARLVRLSCGNYQAIQIVRLHHASWLLKQISACVHNRALFTIVNKVNV